MNWSIRTKVVLIALLSAVALTSLTTIAIVSGNRIEGSVERMDILNQKLALADDMKVANLEMLLAAMDSIIDKAEGTIQPERKEVIAASIAVMRSNGARLTELAENDLERKTVASIVDKIGPLAEGIQVDLAKMIEGNATDEEFAKIDDVIDTYGEGIQDELVSFAKTLNVRFEDSVSNVNESLGDSETMSVVAYVVAILVLGFALVILGRDIVGGVSRMTTAMLALSSGRDDVEIPGIGRSDEIGRMADAVEIFKKNSIQIREMAVERDAERERNEAERKAAMERLAESLRETVGSVAGTLSATANDMSVSSDRMNQATSNADSKSAAVAAAAEESAVNVQTVASAAEELSSSIQEISRQVGVSTTIASEALSDVQRTTEMVQGLTEAADKIGDVVNLITDIAEQTNLLALNATIEAARAGEAGKGFAVVASEVKNLASQTGRATEQISQQITGIQSATQQSAEAIGSISKTIERINEITASVAAAVEQQGAATAEIAGNVEQASNGTNEVSMNIRGVSEAVGETSSAALQITDAARSLAEQSDILQREVTTFIDKVKAS
jgi:methyl-accepting chemotaxis protein